MPFVSAINFWKLSIKHSLGKLTLNNLTPVDFLNESIINGFQVLDLKAEQSSSFYLFNSTIHKDPFDRMLIWQAIEENLILITSDKNIKKYESIGLKTIW